MARRRKKKKPQDQLDSLKAGLAKALDAPECIRNQHGDYLHPDLAMRKIENVLIKHGVTTGAKLLNTNVEKKKGRPQPHHPIDGKAPRVSPVLRDDDPDLKAARKFLGVLNGPQPAPKKVKRKPDLLDAVISALDKQGIDAKK